MAASGPSFWWAEMWASIVGGMKMTAAVLLAAGAATAVIAPSLDMAQTQARNAALNHPTATPGVEETDAPELDFETLLLACLDSFDPDSQACAYAQAKSGLGREEFRARIIEKLGSARRTPEPTRTAEPTPAATPTKPATPKPTVKTTPKPTAKEDFWTVFDSCLDTRDVTSAVCKHAQQLIGFSDADFRAKFDRYLAERDGVTPTPKEDFWTVFDSCLDTGDVTSAICKHAQQLIGFNDADFRAKFDRYLAARGGKSASPSAVVKTPTPSPRTATPVPTRTPTPTPTATSTATPTATTLQDATYKACFDTHDRTSVMCQAALALSGLTETQFWTMIQTRFGPI